MRIPKRYPFQHTVWKVAAALIITALGSLAGFTLNYIAGTEASERSIDWAAYDKLFRLKPPEDRSNGPIALAVIDEYSINVLSGVLNIGWPWPRDTFSAAIRTAEQVGAKAVVFDLTFSEPSVYDRSDLWGEINGDSRGLANAAGNAKIPVVFGVQASATRSPAFVLPVTRPSLGAVNVESQAIVLRRYERQFFGTPTLAMKAATLLDPTLDASNDRPFLVHYYGPFGFVNATNPRDKPTHTRVSIADLILPQSSVFRAEPVPPGGESPEAIIARITPQLKGKVIVVGAVMHTLFDQKSSPYSTIHPGMDFHATAIENLLLRQQIAMASPVTTLFAIILPSLAAAFAAISLRRTVLKLAVPIAIGGFLAVLIIYLFTRQDIFLAPFPPTVALVVATVLGLSWSYITEGRQRRFLSRAFSQYVSPAVVGELERNPDALGLGGQKRTVSVLFSDIRSFTTITEKLDAVEIEKFMNTYLGAMTDVVLASGGTVDKYIGDAVMAFWNAPLEQPDHVVLAVKTALAMNAKEKEIQSRLSELSRSEILTRIGVATGEVMVGNFGSAGKINYTVLGDSVNLASRLEGANKIYGSQILLAEPTALAAGSAVLVRKLGLLRVKGKLQAMAVYEAMGLLPGTPEMVDRKARYEAAFGAYLIQNWPEAVRIIEGLLADYPHDQPAQNFLDLVREVAANPPEGEWDGVYVAHEK